MSSIYIKKFEDLSKSDLYSILRLRSEVFIIEQHCVYQDVDNKDQISLHVFLKKSNAIIAYARLFRPGDYFEEASIGRVVVSQKYRNKDYGKQIMNASINAVYKFFNQRKIKISAQCYLKNFYNDLGFLEQGESYLEDGIPHIAMIKN